ncbi:hypothetical protein [Halanaerobaculum tunisiense]
MDEGQRDDLIGVLIIGVLTLLLVFGPIDQNNYMSGIKFIVSLIFGAKVAKTGINMYSKKVD